MGGTYQAIELGPDKRPCNGRVIAEGPTQESIAQHWKPGEVVIAWRADEQPPRRLSREALSSVRRKRLRRRLERKHPLLADILEAEELAARPAYFAGERMQ